MSLNEYTQEIVRRALVEDVAILCDDPNNKVQITAALLQRNALRSAHTERKALLFVVQRDSHAAQHKSLLAGSNIRSRVVSSDAVATMTPSLWAELLTQTQVVIISGQALLSILKNGVLNMARVTMVFLDISHRMMQGDHYHQLITGFSATFPRPRLVAFARSSESGLQPLYALLPSISTMTASIDSTFLGGDANQVCELVRCSGRMGDETFTDEYEISMEAACSQLAGLCQSVPFLAPALNMYSYARLHLGLWCSALVWTTSLQALRQEASSLPPSQSGCLRHLEVAEQQASGLEMSFPRPTLQSMSEKLCRLVSTLRSAENGKIQPALVIVSSAPSATVIAELLRRVHVLGQEFGMSEARVAALVGTTAPEASNWMDTTVESFKNGTFNILVTSGIALQDLPMDFCHKVVQFDIAALWDVADLAHQYMVVRSSHPRSSFLGGFVLKAMVSADVFVANLKGTPGDLTRDTRLMYRSINNSEQERTSLGMAHLVDGPVGALRSLAQSYNQFPRIQNWVAFDTKYRQSLTRQLSLCSRTPRMAIDLDAIQTMIGYRFSNVQVLVSALSLGTPACERLEFIGDAVLDVVATTYWIKEHPIAERGRIIQVKTASVSNNFLSMVCMKLGLYQFINSSDPIFRQGLAQVMHWHTAMLASNPTGDFWMEVDYPKDLADFMEAIFGAVYIDAAFDLSFVASVFDTLLLPAIQSHLTIDTAVFSMESLGRKCNHLEYTYTEGPYAYDGTQMVVCTVSLGGVVLDEVMSTGAKQAKRFACRRIMERLGKNPDAFVGVCQCFGSK